MIWEKINNRRGVTFVFVAIVLLLLLAFAALAIDVGHIFVVSNELKNASDAGALAAARVLYDDSGTAVNPGANQVGHDAAQTNQSEKLAVEVNWSGGNTGDVERGHWSFATRSFTPNDSLAPVDLWNVSNAELDANPNFINAVRVRTRREATPAFSFFARILGFENFILRAESVAYIGFAGTLRPRDVDQPIGICKQAIVDSAGHYTCNTGRMIDSGGGTTHNTGGWTNFLQPCETASVPTVRPLVCGSGNPTPIFFGQGMGTVGGMQDVVYNDLRACWLNLPPPQDWRGYPIRAWELTLPVIDCPDNNPGPCSVLLGAVTLKIVWIKQSGADPNWRDIPLQMEDWVCLRWDTLGRPNDINSLNETERQQCWQEFATHFNLRTADGTPVGVLTPSQLQKTIFFLPSCIPHDPSGNTGGQNFGILARIPVLVQ